MPRRRTILQAEYPYSVTARCINKEWFSLPMDLVWEIMCHELRRTHIELGAQIHSFVLMSNHYHLLMSTPRANISGVMQAFNSRTSRALTSAGNRINLTYGGRYQKSILRSDRHFHCAYKYIYRNPVKAGASQLVENYKYSSLRQKLGLASKWIPLSEDQILMPNLEATLLWLNTKPAENHWQDVKKALRRPLFRFAKDKKTKKPHILENSKF